MTDTIITEQLTPAQAAEKLDVLKQDKAWTQKLLAGDGATRREFDGLISAKHQADRVDAALAGTLEPQPFETLTGGQVSAANLASSVKHLRSMGLPDGPLKDFLTGEPVSKELRAWVENEERIRLGSAEWRAKYLSGDAVAVQDMLAIKMAKLRPVRED